MCSGKPRSQTGHDLSSKGHVEGVGGALCLIWTESYIKALVSSPGVHATGFESLYILVHSQGTRAPERQVEA